MRRVPLSLALLTVFVIAAGLAASESLVALPSGGYVADSAGVLGSDTVAQLNEALHELEEENGIEIAVATVPATKPMTVEEYSAELFEKWGIGQKDHDNGILVLLAMNDRLVRVEVGYGLEGILPDSRVGDILDRVAVPLFREDRFGEGVAALVDELARILLDEFHPVETASPPKARLALLAAVAALGAAGVVVGVLIMLVAGRVPRCKACMRRMRKEAEEVVTQPTDTSAGAARAKYRCTRCGAEAWVNVALPPLGADDDGAGAGAGPNGSADAGGSGSSGGDGGFGGGESGGGGASQQF